MPNCSIVAADLTCPECGAPMVLRYSRKYERPFYGCSRYERTKCPGTHGAHPNGEPLGIPADCATKAARHELHLFFDQLWRGETRVMSRTQAYRWLERAIDASSRQEAHIGRFTIEECHHVLRILREEFPALHPIQEAMHG